MKLATYPARPINGGRLERAPLKSGVWFFEPKYNGWRTLVHAPSGAMFNRHGERLSIEPEFRDALGLLRTRGLEWLDCEALERRHRIGRGTLLVFDWVSAEPFETRKQTLAAAFEPHQAGMKPAERAVYGVPALAASQAGAIEFYQQQRNGLCS